MLLKVTAKRYTETILNKGFHKKLETTSCLGFRLKLNFKDWSERERTVNLYTRKDKSLGDSSPPWLLSFFYY